MSLPGLQGGTKQGEIISLPAGEIPERWHHRSESPSVTLSLSRHQALVWSELGLGIQERAWTWKSVKTWQMGPSSEWEARGARCSQRGRQGNGESFHKHRNIYMDSGQKEEEVKSHWQSLAVHFSIVSMSGVWTDWGQMMWQCDIIRVGGHVLTSDNHTQPLPTSSQASGECDELMEELSQCGNRFSMDMANILPQLLTQTRPRLALQCTPCDTGCCTIRGLMGLINLQRGTTKIKNKCATRMC